MNLGTTIGNIFTKKKRMRAPTHMYPPREWMLGVGIALLLLSVGALYAWSFFLGQLKEEDQSAPAGSGVVVYNKELVAEVLSTYRARAAQFEIIRREEGEVIVETKVNIQGASVEASQGPLNAE